MSQEIIIQASPCDSGLRLDSFLAKRLPEHTRAQLCKFIKSAFVSINGQSQKPSFKLLGHEKVILKIQAKITLGLIPQDLPLDIIYSDDHIAVINKAVGMPVHLGAGVIDNTLVNALLHAFPTMAAGEQTRPGIVHRLDKNTSGVIVVALTHQAHALLSDAFKKREIQKIYRAFCYGTPVKEQFELKTGHVRHPHNRLRFFTGVPVPLGNNNNVRMAHTSFRRNFTNFGISDLSVQLHTGRTHQIRAHLADINHPLLGDIVYRGAYCLPKESPEALREAIAKLKGQALHAETISFAHPITKEPMSFSAPLPADFMAIRQALQ